MPVPLTTAFFVLATIFVAAGIGFHAEVTTIVGLAFGVFGFFNQLFAILAAEDES